MTSGPGSTAIVLAGGRSSRFGSDKLAARMAGRPLLHHAIRAAAEVCDEVVVVTAVGGLPMPLPADLGVPARVVTDPMPFLGPLVALVTAARAARSSRLLVVGGDMPAMVPAVLRLLLSWPEGHVGAALEDSGIVRPLPCGLDRETALRAATALVGQGSRRLRDLIGHLQVLALPEARWRALDPEARSLRDIDRPSDLLSADDDGVDGRFSRARRGPA